MFPEDETWCHECDGVGEHTEECRTWEDDLFVPREPYEDPNMYLSGSGERADDQSYIAYLNGGY